MTEAELYSRYIKSHLHTSFLPRWLLQVKATIPNKTLHYLQWNYRFLWVWTLLETFGTREVNTSAQYANKGRVASRYFNAETHLERVVTLKRPNCSLSFYRVESKVHIPVCWLSSDKSWVQQRANFPWNSSSCNLRLAKWLQSLFVIFPETSHSILVLNAEKE